MNFTPCPTDLNGNGTGPVYDLSFDSNCAQMIRNIYERFVYPCAEGTQSKSRIPSSAKTKALVVPSAQASSGHSPPCKGYARPACENPLNASDGHVYDELWAQHALELWAWASEDTRLVGFAPYHFSDEPSYFPWSATPLLSFSYSHNVNAFAAYENGPFRAFVQVNRLQEPA